jgi:FkbM family methyltransferase
MSRMTPWALVGDILRRPLNQGNPMKALVRFAAFQAGSRMAPGPIITPFVGDSVLAVSHGMPGATFNVYAGLQDFEDMGFLLHVLRKDDLFIDVGSNVGTYTVLASAVVGAKCIAFEPVPSTFRKLCRNIRLNDTSDLCELHNEGLSSQEGELVFTSDGDCKNRVVNQAVAPTQNTVSVPVNTLNAIVGNRLPTLIKIDVEGFELEVMRGGDMVFKSASLLGVITELNGSGRDYGFEDATVFAQLLEWGFLAYKYDPLSRNLRPVQESFGTGNTLFVRDISKVRALVAAAPRFCVLGKQF